jgi:putative acetyltransferase
MYESYQERAAYYIVERDGKVVGGAGFAPLAGGDAKVCELKKMYLLKDARGAGLGRFMVTYLARLAREAGYRKMYIETLGGMDSAIALYTKLGCTPLEKPLGATGHFGCDRFFLLGL